MAIPPLNLDGTIPRVEKSIAYTTSTSTVPEDEQGWTRTESEIMGRWVRGNKDKKEAIENLRRIMKRCLKDYDRRKTLFGRIKSLFS